MQVKVNFLDNLRLEAKFENFAVIADQPIRYKGDGTAPGPFDYFLASSALCAAYFVKSYCLARDISTDEIQITQDNIVDPDNRYKQTFVIRAELPDSISEKDRNGIVAAMERCSVKRVVQNMVDFKVETTNANTDQAGLLYEAATDSDKKTMILGKDSPLEDTIKKMSSHLKALGIQIEIASWRNIVPHVWSVHIRDADSPMCFTNGKGATKDAALCSALGEYLERISCNYFYNDYYLGEQISTSEFVHYPNEKWFPPAEDDSLPEELMDETLLKAYNFDEELKAFHLTDTNSGNEERGICALPFIRQSDQKQVYIPVNLVGNLFVSNGMSAGNTTHEARVQSLSEIFERAIKNKIIREEITLPDVPKEVLNRYPQIIEGIAKLEAQGFSILVKDASLGGKFPVACVTLMNPKTGGVFASFGSHPKFEVALERSLTELMQGRSFEGMNDVPLPTFNSMAVTDSDNIVEHFIDSTGIVSWKFFSDKTDFAFCDWNIPGSTEEEQAYLLKILKDLDKEVYIADYNHFGAPACRILVPDFSEIYPLESLFWENNNRGVEFREAILNIHQLNSSELTDLVEGLEESQFDEYMPVGDLIGIAFDETSAWGRCTLGELKALIYLALEKIEEAKPLVESFLSFNDSSRDRRKFFQALDIVLDILIRPDLQFENYSTNLKKMYGNELITTAHQTATGKLKFHGLTPTNSNLDGIEKHQRLIESYQKLHRARKSYIDSRS